MCCTQTSRLSPRGSREPSATKLSGCEAWRLKAKDKDKPEIGNDQGAGTHGNSDPRKTSYVGGATAPASKGKQHDIRLVLKKNLSTVSVGSPDYCVPLRSEPGGVEVHLCAHNDNAERSTTHSGVRVS